MRTILVVALALVFGISAALGINLLTRDSEAAATAVEDTVRVVVAAGDISRYSLVSPSQVRLQEYSKDSVPAGALTQIEDAVERVALNKVVKKEILLESQLAKKGAGRGPSAVIPEGKRAFTIQIAKISGASSGFVIRGDKVDVLLTITQPNDQSSRGTFTSVLLQRVEVFDVAPSDPKVDPKELRFVTLLVDPAQATKLTLAQNKGTLQLTLRNPEDALPVADTRITLADIGLKDEKPREASKTGSPAAGIRPGMRTITIQTTKMSGAVSGLVRGDKVDVLLITDAKNQASPGTDKDNILCEVHAVDPPSDSKVDAKELRSVTLLVTPEEAGKLAEGQVRGTLHLTLRNPDDPDTQSPAPPPPAAPKTLQWRTLRGANQGVTSFPLPPS